MPPSPDLIGRTFGRLKVIERSDRRVFGRVMWKCRCSCGNQLEVATGPLNNGNTQSCGCYFLDQVTTHGHARKNAQSPEYKTWVAMIDRVYNTNKTYYPRYGGRGINVCGRWRDSFQSFLDDMGPRPGPGYSIDRIDNDGNYEPGNCRWADSKTQCRNLSTNRLLEHDGRILCMAEWAEIKGMLPTTLFTRIARYKWNIERALTEPVHKHVRKPKSPKGPGSC